MRGSLEGVEAESWVAPGRALLDEVAAVAAPGPADLIRWWTRFAPERVSAALRLVEARRKGASKFSRAREMWLEPTGVEQATAEVVARHKAARFADGSRLVVDLCSGIGGDALALAGVAGKGVLAIDRDPGMNRRVVWNAGVYRVSDRLLAVCSGAETFVRPSEAWVHIDPDRRAGTGGRAKGLADYAPGLSFLRSLIRDGPGGAIKLGPASDFNDQFGNEEVEFELISLAGECKEATLWFGAAVGCRRRATVLPDGATWTDRDADSRAILSATLEPSWLFDPDPALVRSGLLNGFAEAHALSRFALGVDYLAGNCLVVSPFLAAFEVLAVVPLDLKSLRRPLAPGQPLCALRRSPNGLRIRPEGGASSVRGRI